MAFSTLVIKELIENKILHEWRIKPPILC